MSIVDDPEPSEFFVDQSIYRRDANGLWQRHGLVKRHGPFAARERALREASSLVYHTADETSVASFGFWLP